MKVNRVNLKSIIGETNGKFFTVVFTKKDGTERKMNCRLGVKSELKGGKNKVEAIDRPYLTVFDMHEHAYRTVNLSTVKTLSANGKKYDVV